jgi:transposase InsO family protein
MLNRRKYTSDTVKEAIKYLRTGHLPRRLRSVATKGRFRQNWSGFSVRVDDNDDADYDEESDEENDVTYHLFDGDKRIVSTDQVHQIVSDAYAGSQTTGGRDRIYARLSKQYVGISRRAVMKVLKNQEVWQLLRRPHGPRAKRAVRQPILAKQPWVRLQIDLIDMSRFSGHNGSKKWGLTVVDVFSKRAWAIPLRDKSGRRVAKAFDDHVLAEDAPAVVQADNGLEFRNHHFTELAARHGFKQVFSSSYSPQSNGCVERFNKTLKQLIRHHFVSSGSKRWVDVLPDLLTNYNSAVHSSTGYSPDDIVAAWNSRHDVNSQAVLMRAHETLLKKARGRLGSEPPETISVGDHVRVLVSRRKKPMKTTDIKLRRPTWSQRVYTVAKVSRPAKTDLSLPRYTLEGSFERFYANDLLAVDLDQLVRQRSRVVAAAASRWSSGRTVVPATLLQERKRGVRAIRRPARFRSDDDDDDDDDEQDSDGSDDEEDDWNDDDDDEDDDTAVVSAALLRKRGARPIRRPARFRSDDEDEQDDNDDQDGDEQEDDWNDDDAAGDSDDEDVDAADDDASDDEEDQEVSISRAQVFGSSLRRSLRTIRPPRRLRQDSSSSDDEEVDVE